MLIRRFPGWPAARKTHPAPASRGGPSWAFGAIAQTSHIHSLLHHSPFLHQWTLGSRIYRAQRLQRKWIRLGYRVPGGFSAPQASKSPFGDFQPGTRILSKIGQKSAFLGGPGPLIKDRFFAFLLKIRIAQHGHGFFFAVFWPISGPPKKASFLSIFSPFLRFFARNWSE